MLEAFICCFLSVPKTYDKDGNGFISASEFKAVMAEYGTPISDEELAAIIKNADENHDGKIGFEGKPEQIFFYIS